MARWGFAIGVVVGGITGLLFAPRRGADTRARLRQYGGDLANLGATPLHTAVREIGSRLHRRELFGDEDAICPPTL